MPTTHTAGRSTPLRRLQFILSICLPTCLLLIGCAPEPDTAVSQNGAVEESAPASNPLDGDEVITKDFEWTYWRFDDITWHWSVEIPRSLHKYYCDKARPHTRDYSVYATEEADREVVQDLGQTLLEHARSVGLDDYETVHFIAAFVQQLNYTVDAETSGFDNYARYPIETLVAEGGDCEDTAILLGKLMVELGYDVVLVRLPEHIAVGVLEDFKYAGTYYPYNDGKYFYLESTGLAGRVGMVPEEYEGQLAYIYDFTPRSVIEHDWKGRRGRSTYSISLHVENQGTAPAHGCSVYAGFDAGEGRLWNTLESEPFDLEIGEHIDIEMTLNLPDEKHTRLMVYVLRDGKSVDKSHSEWFDE